MMKFLFLLLSFFMFFACKIDQGRIEVTFKNQAKKSFNIEVASIKVLSNQLIVEGSDLTNITNAKVLDSNDQLIHTFEVDSKSNSQLVLNATTPLTFLAKNIFKLVLSNANAAATYTIDFSLCDAKIGNKLIDCTVTPQDGYVLAYDNATDKWKPKSLNGITYLGTFDASGGSAPSLQPAGSYYVISVAGTISTVSFDVGDWIISNGTNYQKIDNSTAVSSVFGRLGAVTALEGDYNLDKLSDVDLTTPATAGKVLKYNGTTNKWEAGDDLSSGGAGSVSSGEILDGTITGTDIAANTITLDKLNGTSDATKYLRGDKTWATFVTDVLNTPLTGFSVGTGAMPAITATDSINQAFGKVQKSLNDLNTDYVSKTATSQSISGSWSFTNPTSFLYTQTPTGVTPTEVTNVQYVQQYVDNAFSSGGAYAPNTLTTVNGAHSDTDTTLTVVSTSGYPSTGTLLIGNELIPYTGKTATTFTSLTRGGFGTTAAAISNGVSVNNILIMARTTTTSSPKFSVSGSGTVSASGQLRVGNQTWANANYSSIVGNNSSGTILQILGDGGAMIDLFDSSGTPKNWAFGILDNSSAFTIFEERGIGYSAGNERFRIAAGGNVGIGTNSPSSPLTIKGTNGSGRSLEVESATGSDSFIEVRSVHSTGRTGVVFQGRGGTGTNSWFMNTGGSDTKFYLHNGNNINSPSSTPLTVQADGSVGIGTNAPAEKLEINGAIKVGTTAATSTGAIRFDGTHFQGYTGSMWMNFNATGATTGACDTTDSFNLPGTYSYVVPLSFGTIKFRLWGGGGGGAHSSSSGPVNGSPSTVSSLSLSAGGGIGGSATPGSGGIGSGGDVNTSGDPGYSPVGSASGAGGNSPNGGTGGAPMLSYGAGNSGSVPGGGGSGGSDGGSADGVGGGAGAYVEKTFTSATLLPGTTINDIIVGAGALNPPGGGTRGGYGGNGRVTITCVSTGSLPANDRGLIFWNSGSHDSDANFVYDSSNQLGLGTATPTEKLHVVGNILATGTVTGSSDIRFKKNIVPIKNALDDLSKLTGVSYDWIEPEKHNEGRQIGLIAQQVEKVFPEAVITDDKGYKSVAYMNLIAPLINAIKELNSKFIKLIESDLKTENKVNDHELRLIELEKRLRRLESENNYYRSTLDEIQKKNDPKSLQKPVKK